MGPIFRVVNQIQGYRAVGRRLLYDLKLGAKGCQGSTSKDLPSSIFQLSYILSSEEP